MSVPTVNPRRSVAHRIVTRVALSPMGLRFLRDVGSRVDPTLIRLTRGRISSVWPFPAVVLTHVGAGYHNDKANPIVTLYGRGVRGRFIAEEIYGADATVCFGAPKTAPGPTASTSRSRPPIQIRSYHCIYVAEPL
jgi:hypothetical protein